MIAHYHHRTERAIHLLTAVLQCCSYSATKTSTTSTLCVGHLKTTLPFVGHLLVRGCLSRSTAVWHFYTKHTSRWIHSKRCPSNMLAVSIALGLSYCMSLQIYHVYIAHVDIINSEFSRLETKCIVWTMKAIQNRQELIMPMSFQMFCAKNHIKYVPKIPKKLALWI